MQLTKVREIKPINAHTACKLCQTYSKWSSIIDFCVYTETVKLKFSVIQVEISTDFLKNTLHKIQRKKVEACLAVLRHVCMHEQ